MTIGGEKNIFFSFSEFFGILEKVKIFGFFYFFIFLYFSEFRAGRVGTGSLFSGASDALPHRVHAPSMYTSAIGE